MHFEPCRAQHFTYIVPPSVQSDEYRAVWAPGYAEQLCSGIALSAWASGACVGAAGVFMPGEWRGRGEAWAILGVNAGDYLLPIIRKMRSVLDNCDLRRVDMMVADGNGNGHALARLCGFTYEAKLEAYHPSGCDAHMYKRISR